MFASVYTLSMSTAPSVRSTDAEKVGVNEGSAGSGPDPGFWKSRRTYEETKIVCLTKEKGEWTVL